jgi:hypothetical protein
MKRKSRDWDLTLELSCHAGCPAVLFVLLRFTYSDYPYGIFKLFSLDTILEEYHQRIIISMFGQIWPSGFSEAEV